MADTQGSGEDQERSRKRPASEMISESTDLDVPVAAVENEKKKEDLDDPVENAPGAAVENEKEKEQVTIKIKYAKNTYSVERDLDSTVLELKDEITRLTSIPSTHQKLIFKAQLVDKDKLRNIPSVKNGCTMMLLATKPEDTRIATTTTSKVKPPTEWDAKEKVEPWCKQPKHQKILEKGVPEDAWPGIADKQTPLRDDQTYIPGLLNSSGVKCRMTFRTEIDQIWIGTATRTQKIARTSVSLVESQTIEGQEQYSIMRIQLGPTAKNSYWFYFVPSQLVAAVKIRLLGVESLL